MPAPVTTHWLTWIAVLNIAAGATAAAAGGAFEDSEPVAALAAEVRDRGWLCYAARSSAGDWDLFLCRPDGSHVRNLTRTPDQHEFAGLFSPDARHLLYRRMARTEVIDSNQHGTQGCLVMARSDGTEPIALGSDGQYPWASWSPDGEQIACLTIKGVLIVDRESRGVVRTLKRQGFFQQLTWSPDGQWLCGVANSFGESWSIARMHAATGDASAINRIDCCTPDWFPDSQQVIFSWRPPGQTANQGYGWTQLWRARADGSTRELVYAEDGRHVYGGRISPDGEYVVFTGNMEEDGDPGRAGAPMALIRLSDAPMIGGTSSQLRAAHPGAGSGPLLTLPVGWEPDWTLSELPGAHTTRAAPGKDADSADMGAREAAQLLAAEVRSQGWLVVSAVSPRGDWDLWRMRPDGSQRQPITSTPEYSETGPRFSPDGQRLLWFRQPVDEPVANDTYGAHELVIAQSDGGEPVSRGRAYPWASWGPDSRHIACLAPPGIRIIELDTGQQVKQLPRRGIVNQLVWSPDGTAWTGTANGLGPFWNIGVVSGVAGDITAVSETDRYNCTSDWLPDARGVVYARGIIPPQGGRAELWTASRDGQQRSPLYLEHARHIYGACVSPDGRYIVFTRSVEDLGRVDQSQTTVALIRWADTPMLGDDDAELRRRCPEAQRGPRLDLGPGWEPHWTLAEMDASGRASEP